MRILDKYILKEFIGPFLFGVCAFTAVFIGTGTLYRIANLINQYGAGHTLYHRHHLSHVRPLRFAHGLWPPFKLQ